MARTALSRRLNLSKNLLKKMENSQQKRSSSAKKRSSSAKKRSSSQKRSSSAEKYGQVKMIGGRKYIVLNPKNVKIMSGPKSFLKSGLVQKKGLSLQRSKYAILADLRKKADKKHMVGVNNKKWRMRPDLYDVAGIDAPPYRDQALIKLLNVGKNKAGVKRKAQKYPAWAKALVKGKYERSRSKSRTL
jgi:hypothetical protein